MTRDRTIDALRAFAMVGVVLGHWLVTAVVSDPYQPLSLHIDSPLGYVPGLKPVTWFLQTLGPFFFAAGFAAARSIVGRKPLPWLGSRLVRLVVPVLALAAVWSAAMVLLTAVDIPVATRDMVRTLVTYPLWFLLVYLVLTVVTPLLRAGVVRYGPLAVLPAVAVVAFDDIYRPEWLALLVVPVAWAVPYMLGTALAEDRLTRAGPALLPLGVAVGVALVVFAGYPTSAVGAPGDRWSNINPPTLFALALTAAQLGLFLLVRPHLARLLLRPAIWAPTAALNRVALTLFCWHQSALLLVTFSGLLLGDPAGLLDAPTGTWLWHRLPWLPLFALTLTGLTLLFHRLESIRLSMRRVPK